MFDTVVWATDGSRSADLALPYAKQLVSGNDTRLLVVHCEEILAGGSQSSVPVHANEENLRTKIERQVRGLVDEGMNAALATVSASAGGAAQAIAEVAGKEHAGVIVVGTRGLTADDELTLGSVTQQLLHLGVAPVLAIPDGGAVSSA
jgi:nucleotide-binding universal stress UspA family protein